MGPLLQSSFALGGGTFCRSHARFADKAFLMPPLSVVRQANDTEDPREVSAVSAENSPDPLQFDDVYNDNFAFVWRVIRRQGVEPQFIDDVCQEVFIVIHRRLPEFEQRAKVRTWIYQIVTNVVRNQRRTQQRKSVQARSQGDVLDPDELTGNEPSPEVGTTHRQAADVAREILMDMNEKQRMAFILVELEGMSLQEVADATEESFHTIRSRLRTARAEFQRHARRLQNVTDWGHRG
jgi:RNA polymerase sigma-70 factor (ECF subfamily)